MAETIIENYRGKFQMKLNPRFAIDKGYLQRGYWEPEVTSFIEYFVKPGQVCVDVGANTGLHTISMADCADECGTVYAFEPGNLAFPRLVDNANLNRELRPNIICEKLGLSNTKGNLKLFYSGDSLGNAYIRDEFDSALWNSGTADDFELCIVTRLDDCLPSSVCVDFMKIDVEGMEAEVLEGARETILRGTPTIIYETLVDCFGVEKVAKCEEILRSLGYHLFYMHPTVGKLAPITSPKFLEDTVALHKSKLIQYADAIFNAGLFVLQPPAAQMPGIELTIVGTEKDVFEVGLRSSETRILECTSAHCTAGVLEFTSSALGSDSTLRLNLFDPTSNDPTPVALPKFIGTLSNDGSDLPVVGHLQAGRLINATLY